jgi:hypothetical protein
MLIVAATGKITVATSFETPASMAVFIVTGSVALLLAVEKAVIIAGKYFFQNLSGFSLATSTITKG